MHIACYDGLYMIFIHERHDYKLRGSLTSELAFLVLSIVIDSDRGHCYEHFKKNQITMKIEPVTYI